MPTEQTPGKPHTRRYSPGEKSAAVRMVRTLRAELGTEHGTVHRIATQLGYGNTERMHGYLGDVPPAEFENGLYATQQGSRP